jgi:DNA-binding transcriptional LysR family regulator
MQLHERVGCRLKLRDLNIFLAVVKERSMSKAGAALAISQPAISKAIADMEHTLGAPLVDRTPHGIEPTLYGRALMKHGVAIFDELRRSVKDIESLLDATVGEARIGCTEPLAAGIVPYVVETLNRRHPGILFEITEGGFAALQRQLRDRNIDLMIGRAPAPVADDDMASEVLFDDRLLVVAGSSNKWARRKTIKLAELLGEPWVLPSPGTIAGSLVNEAFLSSGLKPPRGAGATSIGFHIYVLAAGRYLSMLPESMVRFSAKYLPLKVLPVHLPLQLRPVMAVTLRNRALSPAARLFLENVRTAIRPMVASKSSTKRDIDAAAGRCWKPEGAKAKNP